jgi:OMF family outer membrane factor
LKIGISKLGEGIGKYNYLGSLGKFLPDILMNYNYQYLDGEANIPFGGSGPINMHNPLIITSAGFRYYGYKGGATLFGAMQNRHLYRAATQAKKATISETLLDATKYYYNLLLAEAVLQIRIRAVAVSKAQLKVNQDLWNSGLANRLDVFQSETQLLQDRQNLIEQQITRRTAAIELAEFLNLDQSLDLIPSEPILRKKRLIDEHMHANELLKLAITNRPELKQFEEQRLAAKKAVVVATAPLQPTLAFNGTAYGIGQTLGHSTETVITPITLPTSQGPITQLTSQQVSRQITSLNSLGFTVNWNLNGLGTTALANIQSAKLSARQSLLQSTEELNKVVKEVRKSYLNSLSAQQKIQETISQVRSASEELRLAKLRFENGLSKNIDVLRAQSDYTSSLIEKARAFANFNVAQVQLLHDIGSISVDSLTETVAAVPNNRG